MRPTVQAAAPASTVKEYAPFGVILAALAGLGGAEMTTDGAVALDGYVAGVALLLLAWEARAARAQIMPAVTRLVDEVAQLREEANELRQVLRSNPQKP